MGKASPAMALALLRPQIVDPIVRDGIPAITPGPLRSTLGGSSRRRPGFGPRRLAVSEIEDVAWFVLAGASVIFEDHDPHPTEPTDKIRVTTGADLLPQTGGFELRRRGERATHRSHQVLISFLQLDDSAEKESER
jgi:hypothetical protein